MHLLIGKDKELIRRTLDSFLRDHRLPVRSFYPDTFCIDAFFQEVETLPFLSKGKVVMIHDLDQLHEQDIVPILRYLENPTPWVSLYLTATELHPQNKLVKLVEKKGKVHRFKEEKPWEREKREAEWLMVEAKQEGVALSSQAAMALVQRSTTSTLQMELQKLVCFVGERKAITCEDIAQLCSPTHHETLWQLGDALFAFSATQALKIGAALLEEGMSIFPLLAGLRSQFVTGLELLGSNGASAKKFPYLKGDFLAKKMQIFKKCGQARLQRGVLCILETELKAKNSAADPALLLELLINRVCHVSVS